MTDHPKSLSNDDTRAERYAALHAPHMLPLTRFVEGLRQRKGPGYEIPYFDPSDGGINAMVLFLMEAPGGNAVRSGFVSRNNPDETAKNVWHMTRDAGLDRRECIIWNICPWYVGTAAKIRPVRAAEVRESTDALGWLLCQLHQLRCVALVGRKAQLATKTVEAVRPDVPIVAMPHPSPMFINRAPANRGVVLAGFEAVRRIVS
jgi:hypothetical protein